MKTANYIIKSLQLLDSVVFFVPGGANLSIINAIREEQMPFVCTFGEQGAAWAAEARARVGGIGLCISSSGAAATNLLTSIASSWQDSVPVLFITGQINLKETLRYNKIEGLRQYGWLEVDIVDLAKNITKYCAFVDRPEDIKFHLESAVSCMMLGRPGPVLLDIPFDIQGTTIDLPLPSFTTKQTPALSEMTEIMSMLHAANSPLIIAGHGINAAREVQNFRKLVHQMNVPVVLTPMGKDVLPYDSPLYVGLVGVCGDRGGNCAVQNADMILSIGNSLHIRTTGYDISQFASKAKVIQMDVDQAIFQKTKSYKQVCMNVSSLLVSLLKEDFVFQGEWNQSCMDWKKKYISANEPHDRTDKINLYDFVDLLNEIAPEDTVYITSSGGLYHILPQALRIREKQRLIVSSTGAMGFSVPATIGICSLGRNVVSVIGDGGFQINIQELQTIKHYGFKPKIFIANNGGYATVRNSQKSFYHTYIGSTEETGISFPSIQRIAQLYDIKYMMCSKNTMREDVIKAFNVPEAVLCEVFANPDQAVIPKVAGQLQLDGTIKPSCLNSMSPHI